MKVCMILIILLLLTAAALADVVHMKDGRKLEGEIIKETDNKITLRMKHGTVELFKSQIKEIEKKQTPAEIFRKKAAALGKNDAEGHYRLALWAKENGLQKEYVLMLEKVIAINPEHAGARRALGYKRESGKWIKKVKEPPPSPGLKEALDIIGKALAAKPEETGKIIEKLRSLDGMSKSDFQYCARKIEKWRTFKPVKTGEREVKFGDAGFSCTVSVPAMYDGKKPFPVIITLHGSDSDATQIFRAWKASPAWEKLKEECILIAPQSDSSRWWEPGVKTKLDTLIAEIKNRYNLDTKRIYLNGFSDGAHGAWYYGLRNPDTFAAIAPDSGLPVGAKGDKVDLDSLLNALNLGVYVINSKEDKIAPGERVAEVVRKLKDSGCSEVVHKEYPGGRKVHAAREWGNVYDWFKKQVRNPFPEKLQIFFDGTGLERNCWLELVEPKPGAKASAKIKDNTVEITASGAAKIVVYLSDNLVDLDRKVTVRLNNNRVYQGRMKRSAAVALETCLARGDRHFTYAAKLSFDLK